MVYCGSTGHTRHLLKVIHTHWMIIDFIKTQKVIKNLNRPLQQEPLDTRLKLNVHKSYRRRPGRLLNVLCTFNTRSVSRGKYQSLFSFNFKTTVYLLYDIVWATDIVRVAFMVITSNNFFCQKTIYHSRVTDLDKSLMG